MTGILRILQTAFTVATIAASAAYVAAQDNGLPALAEESATDFEPITTVQLNTVRAELISAAAELERALGGDTPLSIGWKRYLHWSSLAPHLDANEPVTRRNLDQLSHVLERFRANRPGLELPVFVRTANAIERFRPIASWAVSESSLDTRALYQQLLRQVGQQLKRHAEHPTSETELQI